MSEIRRRSRLEMAHLWADFVNKVLGGIALLVAGWWTYTNFTVERTHDPTMEVSVEPAVHPLGGDRVLLNVGVFLRNAGKVAIAPRFPTHDGDADAGLEISIVQIEPTIQEASRDTTQDGTTREPPPGQGPDPAIPWFDWTSGDGRPKPILLKRNLLASNEDYRNRRYQLNPGVRVREPFACVVERNRLYAIRARFWTDEGSVADLVYVDTFRVPEGGR